MVRWQTLPLALLLVASSLLLAPTQAETEPEDPSPTYTGDGVTVRGQSFQDLEVVDATNVVLEDVTVEGTLHVRSSATVSLERVSVGRGAVLESVRDAAVRGLTVHGLGGQSGILHVTSSENVSFEETSVNFRTEVSGSAGIRFGSSSLRGTYCERFSEVEVVETFVERRECPGDSPSPGEPQDYDYRLNGGVVNSDVHVTGARSVEIESVQIRGSLFITQSQNVHVFGLQVTGSVHLESVSSVLLESVHADGEVLLLHGDGLHLFGVQASGLRLEDVSGTALESVHVTGDIVGTGLHQLSAFGIQAGSAIQLDNAKAVALESLYADEGLFLQDVGTEAERFQVFGASVGDFVCRSSYGDLESVNVGGAADTGTCDLRWEDRGGGGPEPPRPPTPPDPPGGWDPPEGWDDAGWDWSAHVRMEFNATANEFAFIHPGLLRAGQDMEVQFRPLEATARLKLASAVHARPAAVQLDSRFEKLIEYEDRDGNGAFDLGDLVVQEHLVAELPVQGIQQAGAGGEGSEGGAREVGWSSTVDYGLPLDGILRLRFTSRDGTDHTKVDVEIHGYPYQSPTSRLALQVRLESAADWSIRDGRLESRLTFSDGDAAGYFSWLRTAQADGEDTEVTARVLEEHKDDGGRREVLVFLGYARADSIVHDPSLGVVEALSSGVEAAGKGLASPVAYLGALLATTAILGVLAALRRRIA